MRFRSILTAVVCAVILGFPGWGVLAQTPGGNVRVDPLLQMEANQLLGKPAAKPAAAAGVLEAPGALLGGVNWAGMKTPDTARTQPPSMVPIETRNGRIYLDAFIEMAPGADTANLTTLGIITGSRSGDILTADIPPEAVEAAGNLPEVIRITGARHVTEMNDAAMQEVGVPTVWNSMGFDGTGVIVGVMDSGIDWTHDDFKHPNGTSRIQFIWDQTDAVGPAPQGFTTTGTEWNKTQIDAGQSRQQDNNEGAGGHGTHVTGTAAGDGSATGNGQPAGRFTGVAHKADIVFVKHNGSNQGMADGVQWMFQKAQALGKPIAINMSLGVISGPHDGTDPLEVFYDGLLGNPGEALIIAAGNSGGQTIHSFSTLVQETGPGNSLNDTPVLAFSAYPGTGIGVSAVEIWYPGNQSIEWRPVWPGDGGLVVGDWFGATETQQQYTIQGGDLNGVTVSAFVDLEPAVNYGGLLVQSPQGGPWLNDRFFYIQLKGAGVPVHAWHIMRDMGSFIPGFVWTNNGATPPAKLIEPDDWFTLATPGTGNEVITVGSYVTKVQWTDINGGTQTQQGATIGQISGFSSRGPRRDGSATVAQQKPDVTGPGEAVISTLSSVLTQRPATDIERDGKHQKMQGTSMSAPVVTGIAALMLQKNRNLTQDQIKTILRNTARDTGDFGWDRVWGAGRVDAVAALNAVQGGAVTRGDVNQDGLINAADAILVLRHHGGQQTLTGDALTAADANESGAVDPTDADWILEKQTGLR